MKQSISCSKTVKNCPEINDYFELVKKNKIRTDKEIKALVRHIEECFKKENLYIEYDKLDKYMKLQTVFPYKLMYWEKCVFALHNCVRKKSDGELRWPDLFLFLGRGNGKNGYFSFESFALMTPINGIIRYDIDMCATSEEQAKISFTDLHDMMDQDPDTFIGKWKWTEERIINRATKSVMRYRTNSPKSKQGLRSGLIYLDEVEEFLDNDNIKTMRTGLGKEKHDMDGNKRSDPRSTYTSTNGDHRDGPLDELRNKADRILFDGLKDNGFLPFIYQLDEDKQVHDKKNWILANPSIDDLLSLKKEIEKEYIDYLDDPIKHSEFMSLHMNRNTEKKDSPVASWNDILATSRPILPIEEMNKLKYCVLGIDYAKTSDMVSACLIFKDFRENNIYTIQHSWFCKQSKDWGRVNSQLRDEAVAKGCLSIVDDVEIPHDTPVRWAVNQGFNIVGVGLDTYRYSLMKDALVKIGKFDTTSKDVVKLNRVGDIMLLVPIIDSLLVNHKLIAGDDPLFRWAMNNTYLKPRDHGNFSYEKIESKSRKTDPWMSFVHGFSMIDKLPDNTKSAVSEFPEVWTF